MTTVLCYSTECVHHNGIHCTLGAITLTPTYTCADGACEMYKDYTETEAYKTLFWAAVRPSKSKPFMKHGKPLINKGNPFRIARWGKKLQVDGLTVFTQQDDRREDDILVTEERTGYTFVLSKNMDPEALEKIRQQAMAAPSVLSLPDMSEEFDKLGDPEEEAHGC